MRKRNAISIEHWASFRLVILAAGIVAALIALVRGGSGHAWSLLPFIWSGWAAFSWLDAWLQGAARRGPLVRSAAVMTFVACISMLWVR